jgi:hypothetical protein
MWCPPSGSVVRVRLSSRPASGRLVSSASSVQPGRCPALRCPASGVHPSGVQPSGVRPRPSGRVRLVPTQAVALGPGRGGGQPSSHERVESRWATAPSGGSSTAEEAWGRATLPSSRVGQWGRWRTRPGWVRAAAAALDRLSDQAGQAGGRSTRRCGCARAPEQAAARGGHACRVAAVLGLGGRPR